MQQLITLFTQHTGKVNPSLEALPSSGSNRKYYRIQQDGISLIGVHGESRDENRAFIHLAKHFRAQHLNVPELVAVSGDEMFYLQEDLGDSHLFDLIKGGRTTGVFDHEEKELLHKTITLLADFQYRGAENLNFNVCYPCPSSTPLCHVGPQLFQIQFSETTGLDLGKIYWKMILKTGR